MDDIRRGLAAQLRSVLSADDGHVGAYFNAAAPATTLQVAGVERMEKIDQGSKSFTMLIEGVFSAGVEPKSQKILDRLLLDESVDGAIEADGDKSGALYSRLQDDGTVLASQGAAAQSVAFIEYRGSGRDTVKNREVLIATWAVEVIA